MKYLGQVVVGVLQRNNTFLVGLRPKGKAAPDTIECPGGKVDPGETLEEALKREYREETNLEIEVGEVLLNKLFDFPDGTYDVYMFKVSIKEGTSTAHVCNVHQWLDYLPLDEIKKYPGVPSMFPILEMVEAEYKTKLTKESNAHEWDLPPGLDPDDDPSTYPKW